MHSCGRKTGSMHPLCTLTRHMLQNCCPATVQPCSVYIAKCKVLSWVHYHATHRQQLTSVSLPSARRFRQPIWASAVISSHVKRLLSSRYAGLAINPA